MGASVERTETDVLYRLPAGGSVIYTDETGLELFRVTSSGDAVKIAGKTIDPDALTALATLDDLTATAGELNALDITTVGVVQASKAVVVDSNKDAAAFRNVTVANLDAGASGSAGSVDVFAGTASKGKLAITTTDQAADTIVSLVVGAMSTGRTITLRDPGAAASFLTTTDATAAATTATAVEISTLAGVTPGTVTAGKAVVTTTGKTVDELNLTLVKVGTVDKTTALAAAVVTPVAGVAASYMVARGEGTLDGSNPTPIATGLTSVVAFTATLKGTAAPDASTSTLTADISGATVNVYAWKPTGAALTELIASTGTESFYWIAVGT